MRTCWRCISQGRACTGESIATGVLLQAAPFLPDITGTAACALLKGAQVASLLDSGNPASKATAQTRASSYARQPDTGPTRRAGKPRQSS